MPEYISRYDTNPLPDPGDSSGDDKSPPDVDPSKGLRVVWSGPQPLTTVQAFPPGGGSGSTKGAGGSSAGGGSGAGGGSSAGGSGSGAAGGSDTGGSSNQPPDPSQEYQHQITEMFGPQNQHVKVEPDSLLDFVQAILDKARAVSDNFNALRDSSEAALSAGWWGMGQTFGGEFGHQGSGKDLPEKPTDDAKGTQQFVNTLRPMQRAALQTTANGMTLSGTFIELLNRTADTYATTDQYSVFPDKSQVSKDVGK